MRTLEAQLVARARACEMLDVGTAVPQSVGASGIPAAVIRRILLGLDPADPVPRAVLLRGALVHGVLDLRDAMAVGGGLIPPLILLDCLLIGDPADPFAPVIDARHARLGRLSLSRCRVGRVDIADATLGGDLHIDGIGPIDDERICQISGMRCRVEGAVIARNAHLRIRHGQKVEGTQTDDCALQLSGAHISGSLELQPGFIAEGGVSVVGARIEGAIWADGSKLSASEQTALRAQRVRCGDIIALRSGRSADDSKTCIVEGHIDLTNAECNVLEMNGIQLRRAPGHDDPSHVYLTGMKAHALVRIADDASDPGCPNTHIVGWVYAQGACFEAAFTIRVGPASSWSTRLSAPNIRVAENLTLQGVGGAIDIELASIGGALLITARDLQSLNARDADIRGSVRLAGTFKQRSEADTLCFDGGNFHGEFELGWNDSGTEPGGVHIRRLSVEKDTCLSIEDARIERDLKVGRVTVEWLNPKTWAQRSPIVARETTVPFYPGFKLIEAVCDVDDEAVEKSDGAGNEAGEGRGSANAGPGDVGVVTFLTSDVGRPVLMLDEADAIAKVNRGHLRLGDDEAVLAYLRFYWATRRGEEGSFLIVDDADQLTWTPDQEALKSQITKPDLKLTANGSWSCVAVGFYGRWLCKATFRIEADGTVEMTEDAPLFELANAPRHRFAAFIRLLPARKDRQSPGKDADPSVPDGDVPSVFDQPFWSQWMLPRAEHRPYEPAATGSWSEMWDWKADAIPERSHAYVSLSGLRAATLNHDLAGTAPSWGNGLMLKLHGFEYDRVELPRVAPRDDFSATQRVHWYEVPPVLWRRLAKWTLGGMEMVSIERLAARDATHSWIRTLPMKLSGQRTPPPPLVLPISAESRLHVDWLGRQYLHGIPARLAEFEPQPYEQLSRVLRDHGLSDVSKEITFAKFALERRLVHRRWVRPFTWIHGVCFSHGLFATRGILTFLAFWLFGTIMFDYANYGRIGYPLNGAEPVWTLPWPRFDARHEPLLVVDTLAVSTFMSSSEGPVMAMQPDGAPTQHEQQCGNRVDSLLYALDVMVPLLELKQEEKCSIANRDDAWPWRLAKLGYAVIGAVVTSLVLLTLSGVLRRRAEQ